jgi:hypothetical protein
LNAVDGPETGVVAFGGIEWVDDFNGVFEWFFVGVVGSEGDVVCGVPVLRCYFEEEGEGE